MPPGAGANRQPSFLTAAAGYDQSYYGDGSGAFLDGGGFLRPVAVAPGTGEPLLDDHFFNMLQAHFRGSAEQQTRQLRGRLNASLPDVLQAMNCVNVVDAAATMRRAHAFP